MHEEILTEEQVKLLPIAKIFARRFGLVGGTAIALHIGHRRSIDFDFFTDKKFSNGALQKTISKMAHIDSVSSDEDGQYSLTVSRVRFTFFQYPYPINYSERFKSFLRLPDLLTLAAMKAYALGRRAKWKDYVDLYFILKHFHPISQIVKKAHQIFGSEFNEKIFRAQLAYFKDIDYSEEIIYMPVFETDDWVIKKALIDFSIS